MKKLLTLFLVVLVGRMCAQTVFAPIGTYWNYSSADGNIGMKTLQYTSDTTINTYTCKKIKAQWYFTSGGANPPDSGEAIQYIYEHNDSIFQYSPGNSNPLRLLYAFTQNAGDSILLTNGVQYKLVFDSLKQISLCGSSRRVLYYSKSTLSCGIKDTVKVIEGLGYVNDYLFSQFPSCIVGDGRMNVECIKTPDCLYSHYGSPCSALAIKEPLYSTSKIPDVYPVPANDILFINLTTDEKAIFELYTINGSRVLNGKIENRSLDVSPLTEGIYILVLKTADKVTREKIVIRR